MLGRALTKQEKAHHEHTERMAGKKVYDLPNPIPEIKGMTGKDLTNKKDDRMTNEFKDKFKGDADKKAIWGGLNHDRPTLKRRDWEEKFNIS